MKRIMLLILLSNVSGYAMQQEFILMMAAYRAMNQVELPSDVTLDRELAAAEHAQKQQARTQSKRALKQTKKYLSNKTKKKWTCKQPIRKK